MKPQMQQHVTQLMNTGQYARAKADLMRELKTSQSDAGVLNALAVVNAMLADRNACLYYAEAAVKAAPDAPVVWSTLANARNQLGLQAEAVTAYERALRLNPADASSWIGRAMIERDRGDLAQYEAILRDGVKAAGLTNQLASALVGAIADRGRADEALEKCLEVLETFPEAIELWSQACMISMSCCRISPTKVGEIHKSFGSVVQKNYPRPVVTFNQAREPKAKLRVGFVSADLRRHSVAHFIEPLFRHLDRSRCESIVYFNHVQKDETTQTLRDLVSVWRDVPGMSDPELARQIFQDQIDILVDLHGHTSFNRMGVFHNKPAPVQLTYLGYPGSTGLASVDGRIVDACTDPPGLTESQHTERLLRLNRCFLCYTPPGQAPLPAAPRNPYCTFGSFNAMHKVSEETLDLWMKVLVTAPESRLLIKSPMDVSRDLKQRIHEKAAIHKIDPSRITCLPPVKDFQDHLRMYENVDAVLDTFPYHGTTTTCEAIYMGVPVVILAGASHVSRVGASLLHAVGRDEWVARDRAGYVSIARALSDDLSGTRSLRQTLRQQLLSSELCDQIGYAREMTNAFHQAWQWWCAGAGA